MAHVLVNELARSSEVSPNVLVRHSLLTYLRTRFYECDGFEPSPKIFQSVNGSEQIFCKFFTKNNENRFCSAYYWQVR